MLLRFFYFNHSALHLKDNIKIKKVIVKRIIIYIPILILLIQSCQNKDNTQLKNNYIFKNDSVNKEEVNSNANAKEQVELVKKFMKWYINNSNLLDKFDTIGGGAMDVQGNEEAKNYYVDFNEVEKYITELKKSDFLTAVFLNDEKQRFVEGDKYFKENPENDAPPIGFDYDRFFLHKNLLKMFCQILKKVIMLLLKRMILFQKLGFHCL